MRNADYSADLFGKTVAAKAAKAAELTTRLIALQVELEHRINGVYDEHAHTHAAERLEFLAKEFNELSESLRSVLPYTLFPPIKKD